MKEAAEEEEEQESPPHKFEETKIPQRKVSVVDTPQSPEKASQEILSKLSERGHED